MKIIYRKHLCTFITLRTGSTSGHDHVNRPSVCAATRNFIGACLFQAWKVTIFA